MAWLALPRPAQVVRQRDTLRQLLQSAGNDLDAARKVYATSLGAASPGQPGAGAASPQPAAGGAAAVGGEGGASGSGAGGPDFRAMHADMEQQLREYKAEATKTQEMLSTDVRGRWGAWGGGGGQWRSGAFLLLACAISQACSSTPLLTGAACHIPASAAGAGARGGERRQVGGQPCAR